MSRAHKGTPHAKRVAIGRARHARRQLSSFFGRGGYEAARTDLRELTGWTPPLGSADSDSLGDIPALRARSRDAERNMPLAGGAILTQLDNVVGGGLTPAAEIDREYLDLSDEQAEAWEAAAERIFAAVTATNRFDVSRRLNFAQMQRVALRTVLSSGDAFGVRRYLPRPGDLLALKVQLLEADRCANPPGQWNSTTMRDGVEFDAWGAPVRYWFTSHHPFEYGLARGAVEYAAVPAFGSQSGEPMVLHVFEQLRPEQSRGIPYLAPVLRQLKQLDRYTDSELAAAVIASFFTVFLKRSGAIDDGPGLEDLTDPMTQSLASAAQDIKLGQGAIVGLEEGDDISIADPKRPNAQFSPFVLAVTRMLGVGLGIPHELLIKHFTASYSASRAALIEAWRAFEARQQWLTETFCQPIYEWVISEAVARGLLVAPGFFEHPLIRRAYLGCTWNGPTMGQLDEAREVSAATQRVEQLFSDRTTEAARLTGKPFSRILAQQRKEKRQMAAAGLQPGESIAREIGQVDDPPEHVPPPPSEEEAAHAA